MLKTVDTTEWKEKEKKNIRYANKSDAFSKLKAGIMEWEIDQSWI